MKHTSYLLLAFCLLAAPLKAQETQEQEAMKYRRSSIYSVLVNHSDKKYCDEIGKVFLEMPVPDKYNDHNLSLRTMSAKNKIKQEDIEEDFINQNAIASQLISHWFNRDESTGQCNTELIKERGLYNASEFDKELADRTARGKAMLEDAGEELIGNTFVLMNDIRYVDKEKTSKNVGSFLRIAGNVAAATTGQSALSSAGDLAGTVTETLKGFRVNIDTYLYQLVWDEETAMNFYTNYYSKDANDEKCKAFEKNRGKFKLKFIGSQKSNGGTTSFIGVNLQKPEEMIRKACQRALDENVVMLQRNFESFKIKTPLTNVSPICAEIGLKEGISPDSKFEVLEAVSDENNKVTYKRVGTIKPDPELIWDNRYMAVEEGAKGADLKFTTFKKVSGGDFYPGLLIREIK